MVPSETDSPRRGIVTGVAIHPLLRLQLCCFVGRYMGSRGCNPSCAPTAVLAYVTDYMIASQSRGKRLYRSYTANFTISVSSRIRLTFYKRSPLFQRFCCLYLLTQPPDALPIGIFRLHLSWLRLIAHADVPFAKRQPDLRLVQRCDAQPLPPSRSPQHLPLRADAQRRVLQ